MKFDFYLNKGDFSGEQKKLADESFFEANQTYRIREHIYYRSIIYYLKTNTGFSKVIDGDYPRIILGIGDNIGKILSQINKLYDYYVTDDLLEEIAKYPYIANTLPNYKHCGFHDCVKKEYERFKTCHPEFIDYGSCSIGFDVENNCLIRGWFLVKSVKNLEQKKALTVMVNYADNLITEVSHFRINLNKLRKKGGNNSTSNSGFSPKVEKALLVGGIFLVRAAVKIAARSIGTDADINFDISSPDVDIPEFDFDVSNDTDYQNSFSDNNYYGDTNNISFMGKDTLPPNANADGFIPKGEVILNTTVSDIPNHFKQFVKGTHRYILYNGNYFQIDGGGTVTIGGIKYNKI